jgi:hypothetical protein
MSKLCAKNCARVCALVYIVPATAFLSARELAEGVRTCRIRTSSIEYSKHCAAKVFWSGALLRALIFPGGLVDLQGVQLVFSHVRGANNRSAVACWPT